MNTTVALIRRFRDGDCSALNDLFDRYYERVYRLVRIELAGQPIPGWEIVDVVQDVFLHVTERMDRYEERPDAQWISWLAKTARNAILNRRREARAEKRGSGWSNTPLHTDSGSWLQVEAHCRGVVTEVVSAIDKDRVDSSVPRLREELQRVVLLRDYEGHDWATIANKMERSAEACQQLHVRARVELRRLIQQT